MSSLKDPLLTDDDDRKVDDVESKEEKISTPPPGIPAKRSWFSTSKTIKSAIKIRGLAYSRGWNSNGQLGHNDVTSRIKPHLIERLANFGGKKLSVKKVVCGSRCCLAVRLYLFTYEHRHIHTHTHTQLTEKGSLFSWGRGDDGQLGHGDKNPQRKPRLIEAFAHKSMTSVAARGSHAVAIDSRGGIYVWGKGEDGQLGTGTKMELTPRRIKQLDNVKVREVACGRMMTVAIALGDKNEVYTWGCNDDGSTGHGQGVESAEFPKAVKTFSGMKIRNVSCGSRHTLVVNDRGQLYSFGWGIYGQLGLGDRENHWVPKLVKSFSETGRRVLQVATGYRHSFAICDNIAGHSPERRNKKRSDSISLLNVSPNLAPQPDVAPRKHVEVWAWGWNQYGQLGDGTTSSTNVPIPINLGQGVHLTTIVGICGGGRHSLAVLCNDRGVHELHAF